MLVILCFCLVLFFSQISAAFSEDLHYIASLILKIVSKFVIKPNKIKSFWIINFFCVWTLKSFMLPYWQNPQIHKGYPRHSILPHVMASLSMRFKFRVLQFLPTAHEKTNAKQMCPWSSLAMQHFMCVYLHAETAVDVGNMHTCRFVIILTTGKLEDPKFELQSRIQM